MDVMVVDDEALIRELMVDELAEVGVVVTEAASAEAALQDIAQEGLPPSVVVTDVNLGPGMDGVELAAEVRRRWPNVWLIIVTGDIRNLERLAPGSCDGTYVKPFNPRRLAFDVQNFLGRGA
ncbi:response regulator [Falsiroseomonas sp.]|uniref:response regulator n=1 Tax=Falsiroseomonas sp. TaxID=2870721 RepID=UPI003562CF3D